jgi:hypothetical protein
MHCAVLKELSMNIYSLHLSTCEAYECGATLLSLLAHPTTKSDERERAEFHRALCWAALGAVSAANPNWANMPQRIKPCYLMVDVKVAERWLERGQKLLGQRLIAARMAMPFLQRAQTGTPPRPPRGVPRLSLNTMAGLVLEDAGMSNPHNLEARIFRPSRPVIHVAAALAVAIDGIEKHEGRKASTWDFLFNADLIRWVVEAAANYEALLPELDGFHVAPEQVIRIQVT